MAGEHNVGDLNSLKFIKVHFTAYSLSQGIWSRYERDT